MYQVNIPLYGIDKTYKNYVLYTIGNDIITFLNLDPGTSIKFIDIDTTKSTGTIENMEDSVKVRPIETRVYIEAEESYDFENINQITTSKTYRDPIFLYRNGNIELKPVMIPVIYRFTITCTTRSKTEANQWYDKMYIKIAQYADTILHKIKYSYYIPSIIAQFLYDIYNIVKNYDDNNYSFNTFLKKYSDGRMRWITDQSRKHTELAIEETRTRILGRFEVGDLSNKIEYDKDTNIYKTSIGYEITLDRPSHIHMRYPVMIYNNLLDNKYILPKRLQEDDNYNTRRDYMDYILRDYEKQLEYHNKNLYYFIRVPVWDRFNIPNEIPYMAPIMSMLIQISETDKRNLIKLDTLEEVEIKQEIIDWFKTDEYPYLNRPYGSFFYLGLWKDDTLMDKEAYEVDNNLNVYSLYDLDVMYVYRLVLYMVLDPTVISNRGWNSAKNNLIIREIIENAINIQGDRYPYSVSKNGYNTNSNIDTVHNRSGGYGRIDTSLTNKDYSIFSRNKVIDWNYRKAIMKTVQLFSILSYRRGDLNANR